MDILLIINIVRMEKRIMGVNEDFARHSAHWRRFTGFFCIDEVLDE